MSGVISRLTQFAKGLGLEHKGHLLGLVLNNMTQGVVMFDMAGRFVVCNEQYRSMYGLSPDVVKIRCYAFGCDP